MDSSEVRYSIFAPKSKHGLLTDYPELKKYPKLKELPKVDLLFVWFYACKLSPLHLIEDQKERISLAVEHSYNAPESNKRVEGDKLDKLISGSFFAVIESGIEQMRAFKPGARIRANKMVDKIFGDFEEIINEKPVSEMSADERKEHVAICEKVHKSLRSLVEQAEGEYGVSEQDDDSIFDGENYSNDFHTATE